MNLNKLSEMVDKVDLKIKVLQDEKRSFDYIPGFNFGKEIPYECDLVNPENFKRYYEIDGAIDFLKFFKEYILLDYKETYEMYNDHYPDDQSLVKYPDYMTNGYFGALSLLKDII